MKSNKETDHRKTTPAAVYELKKVALKLRKNNKTVKEISEFVDVFVAINIIPYRS